MGYVITAPYLANPLVSVHKSKAAHQLQWVGYDALQAGAQLDTPAGHRVAHHYNAVADPIERGEFAKGETANIELPHKRGNINIKRI